MSVITTLNLRNKNVKNFINSISGSNATDFMYLYEGRIVPWPNEPIPDTAVDTVHQLKDIWDNMIFGKLITFNNLSMVVNRYNWTSNTVYTAYGDTVVNLYNSQFYVITSNSEVYKCLSNNNGNPATVEPVGIGAVGNNYIQTTSDAYQWKYVLQVQPNDVFINHDYFGVPIIPPPNSLQALIQSSAVPGSLDVINVIAGGTGYIDNPQAYIITISGDGVGANAYANVAHQTIQNIVMVTRGQGYNFADVTVFDSSGVGAIAKAVLPPPGGHGFEADTELGSHILMVTTITSNSEFGFLTTTNQIRQNGLFLNPLKFGSTEVSSNSRIAVCDTFNVSGGIGSYLPDEIVFQGTSINTSTFSGSVMDFDDILGVLRVNNTLGVPILNGILYGLSSGAQRYITNIINPDVQKYTGTFLEINNDFPIQLAIGQQEEFQYIISF